MGFDKIMNTLTLRDFVEQLAANGSEARLEFYLVDDKGERNVLELDRVEAVSPETSVSVLLTGDNTQQVRDLQDQLEESQKGEADLESTLDRLATRIRTHKTILKEVAEELLKDIDA